MSLTFNMAAVASLILGVFSFTLPATPPTRGARNQACGRCSGWRPSACSSPAPIWCSSSPPIAICIPLAFYYNFTNLFLNEVGVEAAAAVQSLGQVSEVAVPLITAVPVDSSGFEEDPRYRHGRLGSPIRLLRLRRRRGLVLRCFWSVYCCTAVCYDFFFVAGQIYTNRFAGDRFRSSAQGLITLATYGVGILIGSLVSGPIVDYFATADNHEWRQIWIIPAVIAGVVFIVFLLLFKDRGTPAAATVGLESSITTLEAPGASLPPPQAGRSTAEGRPVDQG